MKIKAILRTSIALASCGALWAQEESPDTPPGAPVPTAPADATDTPDVPPPPPGDGLPGLDTPPAGGTATDGVGPVTPPDEEPVDINNPITESEGGFLIKDAALNDIFQFLAKEAGRQYFHNVKIATPEYRVTGHLNEGEPLQQMEELAFMYGLLMYEKGNTVYALTQSQLNQLPSAEFNYQLRYLRPTDIEQIKELIRPVLSPGTGIVNFEPKTNTVVIIDTAHRIDQARNLLHKIDQPKGQIIVETKILRINSSAAEREGVNWSSTLGETGTTLEITRSLNSVFGIPDSLTAIPTGSGIGFTTPANQNLVLNPVQITGVLRALAEGGMATQISNPTLITEDNEQGTISIIDRVPIITTTTTANTSGGNPTVTEEVRYQIDEGDPTIADNPENHREIGISVAVTPTLLPDGTVRMKLRPRSAQITDTIISAETGNEYPRVNESMIESLSRVPDGHSLVIGGFYGQNDSKDRTKVPLLGDIPVLNFFFKSKETIKEQSSLVFIVTPTSYDPASTTQNGTYSNRVHNSLQLTRDHDWVDPLNPGPAHEPNWHRGVRGMQPQQAPYYPTSGSSDTSTQGNYTENKSFFGGGSRSDDDKPNFSRARRRF